MKDKRTKVKISLDLSQVSDKCGKSLATGVKVDKLEVELKLSTPDKCRATTKLGEDEQKALDNFAKKLTFLTQRAPPRKGPWPLSVENASKVIYYAFPDMDVGESDTLALARLLVTFHDKVGDKLKEKAKEDTGKVASIVTKLLEHFDPTKEGWDQELIKKVFEMKEKATEEKESSEAEPQDVSEHKPSSELAGPMYNFARLLDASSLGMKGWITREIKKLIQGGIYINQYSEGNCPIPISLETLETLRGEGSGFTLVLQLAMLLRNIQLPDKVLDNFYFQQVIRIASILLGIEQDVLGFQKGVQEGKEVGMLMWRVRKGQGIQEALKSELDKWHRLWEDFEHFQTLLGSEFKDHEATSKIVNQIVNMIHSFIFGMLQVANVSPTLGIQGKVTFIEEKIEVKKEVAKTTKDVK